MDRVLAFGCHPDDVEFECAGTLILLKQVGYEIHIAEMAGGEMGSPVLPPQQIRERRLNECVRAAATIGAEFHYAGGYDCEVEYSAEYRRRAVRIVREVDPLIVFTNPPMDYMVDHEETSKLVRNASYVASVPNFDCGYPVKPTLRIPHLYYWNASGQRDIFGRPLPINRVVDITSVIDTKIAMLECHESQREWLSYHNGWDEYVNMMIGNGLKQGELIGVKYAEGYVQHLGNNYPEDDLLGSILGDLCVQLDPLDQRQLHLAR